MTDIMKLADNCANACADVREFLGANAGMDEADGTWIASQQARAALQSAIEALQEENALLEGTLESRGRNIAALQAENEQFRLLAKANSEALGAALVERDALQAKLDAMGKGEPVAYSVGNTLKWHEGKGMTNAQLYAAPKALAPLTQPEVVEAFCNTRHNTQYVSVFDAGVRFAEKHHGIGGTP